MKTLERYSKNSVVYQHSYTHALTAFQWSHFSPTNDYAKQCMGFRLHYIAADKILVGGGIATKVEPPKLISNFPKIEIRFTEYIKVHWRETTVLKEN